MNEDVFTFIVGGKLGENIREKSVSLKRSPEEGNPLIYNGLGEKKAISKVAQNWCIFESKKQSIKHQTTDPPDPLEYVSNNEAKLL